MVIGNSFFTVEFFTLRKWIQLHTPSINNIFKILLPITFPRTISPWLLNDDFIETANSGALVPKATIVKAMNILDK